jgi:MFS family permease
MVQKNPERNIIALYIIKFSRWFLLIMPIMIPFYYSNGLDQMDVMWVQAGAYSLAFAVLEIPSGYLADIWGRKKTLFVGTVTGFAGYLIYCFAHNLEEFMVAEFILGIGASMISGTDSAMLYDTLLDVKREKEYMKYEGRVSGYGLYFESAASLIGGLIFLTLLNLRIPFYFQAVVAFAGIPASLVLYEPDRHVPLMKFKWNGIFRIIANSLWENNRLRIVLLFSSFVGGCTLTFAWYVQAYWRWLAIPEEYNFLLWTPLNLTAAVFTIYAYRFERFLKVKWSVLVIALFLPLGFFALGVFGAFLAIAFMFFFYFIRGFANPVLKDYINRRTTSDIRATVLSIRTLMIRTVFFMVGGLTMGQLTRHRSLVDAFLVGGVAFFLLCLISVIFFLRSERK